MSQEERIFAEGFIFKRNPKAPDFIVGRMSVKVEEAIQFLRDNEEKGWVNMDVKQARNGNYYIELDTFKPANDSSQPAPAPAKPPVEKTPPPQTPAAAFGEEEDDDLPF